MVVFPPLVRTIPTFQKELDSTPQSLPHPFAAVLFGLQGVAHQTTTFFVIGYKNVQDLTCVWIILKVFQILFQLLKVSQGGGICSRCKETTLSVERRQYSLKSCVLYLFQFSFFCRLPVLPFQELLSGQLFSLDQLFF